MSAPVGAPAPSVTKRALRGVAWTLPTTLASRVVGLVGTLVLARYLAPAEYGEVSAAAILTLTAANVTTFGVGVWLVSSEEVSRSDAFHATVWFLATGAAAMAVVWALSGPLGGWFGVPAIGRFMPVLLAGMALDRVAFLPERMLVRRLEFRWLSLSRAFAELVFTGVAVGLAAGGVGAMSIAWANLARSVFRAASIVPAVPWREWIEPHRLRAAALVRILRYGVNVAATSIAEFAIRRWDNLIIARTFGPAAMGAYNYAYNLADVPAVAVGEQMSDVAFASLPRYARDKRGPAVARAFTMVSLIMLPLGFGLGAVAETVVRAFFDAKWASVGEMLMVLSVLAVTRPMMGLLNSYLYACDRPQVVLGLAWAGLAALVAALASVGRLGMMWACGAVAAVFVVQVLAALAVVKRLDGLAPSRFLRPLAAPAAACGLMVAAIVASRAATGGLAPAARLALEVALGAAVYLAGALVLFRATARDFLGLVRAGLSRS
jgi:PST family polysaccharide transporter